MISAWYSAAGKWLLRLGCFYWGRKAARDLGVTLDSNLTYNEHIVSTVSSCISRLGQINRVKHFFGKRASIIILNVFSKLFYCSSVWSNTTQANLDKLQAVQNFACRILWGAKKFDQILFELLCCLKACAGYQSGNNFIFVLLFWFLSAWRDVLWSI